MINNNFHFTFLNLEENHLKLMIILKDLEVLHLGNFLI